MTSRLPRIRSDLLQKVKRTILPEKVLLEKSGDESGLTTLATSVHAVMLESDSCILPELITKTRVEYVTVTFQSLSNTVVVYGSLGGRGCMVKRVSLNKNRFVSVIDLVVDTLKFEKQASCSSYRDVFTFWKMVKDGLSIPLLTCLCEKYVLPKWLAYVRRCGVWLQTMVCGNTSAWKKPSISL
ncbi:hypothetical protein Bca52824_046307 [Brassica carinata]|uniref:Uncharacterized protein n=1 Tax=Brassica carinata TaxID=52824 RepID=A0A8X7RCM1_BRACI|nr:hypothetical protein Bca52824_046303 [Brassica carinata]KAG2286703.1 hypothetical protein Bca52824_046307 [Brassica carinata]